jgi:uncharacterized repeat protein (TIGR01451 family)
LTVLTILSMAVPFVQAAPSTAGQTKDQPAPPLTRPERTLLPGWAKIEQPAPPAREPHATRAVIFMEDFSGGYPPAGWTETQGVLADPTSFSGTSSNWIEDGFANNGTTGSARINIYGTTADEWAFTPQIDLGLAGDNQLAFDLALTPYSGTGPATLGPDDIFAVVISNTGVVSTGSVLQQWDSSTPISNLGDYIVIDLTGYTGIVQFGFYGFSNVSNVDNNVYVDNIEVGTAVSNLSGSTKTADFDLDTWTITYTIDIENLGVVNAANVYLTDTIPANTGYVASSAVASTGTITEGVGYLEWGGTVLSQTTEYLTFTVGILGAPLYDTTITNTAWISDPMASGWISVEAVVTTPPFAPDLSTSAKDTVPENAYGYRRAVVGTPFPYIVTITNTGVASAANAMVTDTFPTGSAAYVPASAWADSGNLIVASDMLTWTGVVTNGEAVQIGFMMNAISLGLSVDNTAWITGDGVLLDVDAPLVGIQNPNAYCEGAIALDPTGDIVLGTIGTYDDDDAFWGSGDDVWFTVTPTASGIMTLTTETGNDLAIGTSDGGCGGTFTTLDYVYGSGEINVNVAYNQLYYVMVDDTGDYTLTIEAEYELLQPRFDGWKEGPSLVVAGDPIPYTVYAENYGEMAAATASIVDTFPSGTTGPATNVVVDGPGSIVVNDASGLEWNGALAVSEGVTITFELSPTVPCLEPIMTNTAVISDPAASAVVVEASPVDTVIELYLGEGFEGAFPPAGWTNEVVVATGSPTWTQDAVTAHPAGYPPHGGSYMARFNSYSVSDGGAARLSSSSVDFSMATDPEVSFWMFHDDGYSTSPDRIQVQVSIDGGTVFTDVGAAILRYDSSGDFWAQHVVDLADYVGESDVIVGFLAISDYGNDIYIDDVTISSPCPSVELGISKSGPDTAVIGEVITYTILVENYGVVPATGVELTDLLDLNTTYAGGASANHGTLDDSHGTLAMGVITWTGNVTYGESLMLTIPVTVGGECGDIITNTAIVTHTSLGAELEDSVATMAVETLPLLEEHFEGAFPPAGWTITTSTATDCDWMQGDPSDNLTGGSGYFADADSDDCGSGTTMDTELWSPQLDLSSSSSLRLEFAYDYRHLSTSSADVDISTNGGITWTTIWSRSADDRGPATASIDLTPYTGSANTRIRFHYVSPGWYWWWQIDDVRIYEPWSPCAVVTIGPDQSQALCPELSPAVYNLDVTNLTPSADTINITLEDVDWAGTTVDPAALMLAPGETGVVTVTVPISMAAAAGDNDEINVVAAGSVYSGTAALDTAVSLAKDWTFEANSPHGARFLAVVYHDDHMYQIGGYDGSAISDTFSYDIAGDYWLTMTGMITGVYYMDGAAIDGNIYVPGGQSASSDYNDFVQVYSTTAMAWSTVTPMPAAMRGHDVVALDGLLYVIGGYDGGYLDTLYVYTPTTGIWGTLAPMNNARAYASAGVIDGKIYVAGGYDGAGMTSLEIYDPVAGTWSDGADLPEPWVSAADGVKHDRFLILSGGAGSTFTASNGAWMYDAVSDAWYRLPWLNTLRYASEGDGDGTNYYMIAGREYDGSWFYSTTNERLLQCGECAPPRDASFTYDPLAPEVGETVTFNGAVGGGSGNITYTWDFGDGNVGTGMDVTHVYTDAGDFVVELTATNVCGEDVYADTVSAAWPCESLDVDKSGPLTATSGTVAQMQVVLSSTFFVPGTVMTDVLPAGMEYAGNVDATHGTAWYDAGAIYWTTDEPIYEPPTADVFDKVQENVPVRSLPAFESIVEDEEIAKGAPATLKGNGQASASVPVQAHNPLAATLLAEGFEAGIMPPAGGWSVVDTNSTRNWETVDAATYPDFVRTGDYAGWVNYVTPEASDEWLLTPDIDLTGISAATLEFWGLSSTGWCPGGGTGATMLLHVTDTGGTPLATLWDMCTDTTWDGSAYEQVLVDLSAYADQTVKVAWQYVGIDGDSFGLDDILLTTGMGSAAQPVTITFDVTITASSGEVVNVAEAEYCEGVVSDTHTIDVWPSCNPVTSVSFDYSPAAPETDETITFTGTVNAGTMVLPVDYTWDFGGLIKYGNPVTNSYAVSDTYLVTVEAINPCTPLPVIYSDYVTVVFVEEMYYIYLPVLLK